MGGSSRTQSMVGWVTEWLQNSFRGEDQVVDCVLSDDKGEDRPDEHNEGFVGGRIHDGKDRLDEQRSLRWRS